MLSTFAALVLLFLLVESFPIVLETKQAVVVRFGKPVPAFNQFKPGRPIGAAGAGINFRVPFVDQLGWIDKRLQDADLRRQQVISTHPGPPEIDAFPPSRPGNPPP